MTLDLYLMRAREQLKLAARELAKLQQPGYLGLGTGQYLDLAACEGTLKEMLVMVKKMQAMDSAEAAE